MMPAHKSPRLTRRLDSAQFAPVPESAYVYASAREDRSGIASRWVQSARMVAHVEDQGRDSFTVRIGQTFATYRLRSRTEMSSFASGLPETVYLDITGLDHQVWAPMLRSLLAEAKRLWVTYLEPAQYTRSLAPTEGTTHDLSERFAGIAPLPGFARLREVDDERCVFVPILGFEGTRLVRMVEHVQPSSERTIPIVGVPGFRPEFPFDAFRANRIPLLDADRWRNLRYATANCPFDLFFVLREIAMAFPGSDMRLAPIGTKPHGLGAVLFALSAESVVELIYDNPIRKAGRTRGSARLCLYDVATFVRSEEFRWHESGVFKLQ